MFSIKVKEGSTYTDLTDNLTLFKVDDEIIWSSNTGRSTTGKMLGTVIAEKRNIELTWSFCTDSQVKQIKKKMCSGFFTFCFHDAGEDVEISGYRATLSKETLGYIGDGTYYYKSVSTSFVEQ